MRVLVVDDEPLIRTGLSLVVDAAPDLCVAGVAGTGAQALTETRRLRPDVVLLDIRLPDRDGIEVAGDLRLLADAPRVVMVTTFGLDDHIERALHGGADGFLLKDAPAETVQQAVRAAARGQVVLSPEVARHVVDRYTGRAAAPAVLTDLTEREREILDLVADGRSNAEIAAALFISLATVKTHVTRVLAKLGVRSRAQAIVLAHRHGLTGRRS
ncbi:DNA-binding response regulator [Actinoplanes teichomyceticus]|nr:DNA-binding response regulator [Actinoplanes teichomyceticus]